MFALGFFGTDIFSSHVRCVYYELPTLNLFFFFGRLFIAIDLACAEIEHLRNDKISFWIWARGGREIKIEIKTIEISAKKYCPIVKYNVRFIIVAEKEIFNNNKAARIRASLSGWEPAIWELGRILV